MGCRIAFTTFLSLLLATALHAQVNFATYVNLSEKIRMAARSNGSIMVHEEKGRFLVYAVFSHQRVTTLYAVDTRGKKINAIISRPGTYCEVAFRSVTDRKLFCYDIDCNLLQPAVTAAQPRVRPDNPPTPKMR